MRGHRRVDEARPARACGARDKDGDDEDEDR
jgi:hypothetical protein